LPLNIPHRGRVEAQLRIADPVDPGDVRRIPNLPAHLRRRRIGAQLAQRIDLRDGLVLR
jgi:hypothetical protein